MLLLKKKSFEIETDTPVVAADAAATVASAAEIVAAAESEAEKVRTEAKRAYEDEKRRGYEDGIAEAKTEMLMQRIDLVDESVRYMASIEKTVCDLVMKALRKCVAEVGDKELVAQIVKKAMQAVVRNQRQIRIRVHSDMVGSVKARVDGMLKDFPTLNLVDVVEDSHLEPTACVVETEAGIVEASVEGQLKALEASIEKNFKKQS